MSMEDLRGGASAPASLHPIGHVVMAEKGQILIAMRAKEMIEAGEGQGGPTTCS